MSESCPRKKRDMKSEIDFGTSMGRDWDFMSEWGVHSVLGRSDSSQQRSHTVVLMRRHIGINLGVFDSWGRRG
jgi:hypothetical protein